MTSGGRVARAVRDRREDVGVLDELEPRRRLAALLDLVARLARRRASRRRRRRRRRCRPAAPRVTAASISSAVSTCTLSRPAGSASATGPETSVTRAPSAPRLAAMAGPACRRSGWRCSAPDRSARASGRWSRARGGRRAEAASSSLRAVRERDSRRRKDRSMRVDQLRHLGKAAGARLAALGHLALVGPDEVDAVGLQQRDVALRRRIAATCAGSWPARRAPACRWRAARWWRDRRHGRPPSWRGGRPWPARRRSGRPRATGGCGRSRARR